MTQETAVRIAPCITCQSPGKFVRMGIWWMVVPKRIKQCELHKSPEARCRGSVAAMCRSGVAPRAEALRQWNSLQEFQP